MKRWKKACLFLLVFYLICFFFTGLLYNNRLQAGDRGEATVVVVVQPGDTLWSIAKEHLGEEADPRWLIYEIGRLNQLQSALIYPGQTLLLPAGSR